MAFCFIAWLDLVNSKFAAWRRSCLPRVGRVRIVQDHEKCLWQDASLRALKAAGCDVALEIHQHNQRVDIVNLFAFMFHWSRAKMAGRYVCLAIAMRHPLDKTL